VVALPLMSLPSRDLYELDQDASQPSGSSPSTGQDRTELDLTIKEAERALSALKLTTDPNEKARHSTRFKQLLAEGERLKRELRPPVNRAGASESHATPPSPPTTSSSLTEPMSTRKLPTPEQILLLNSGFLNECKFPPWTGPPDSKIFELKEGEGLYEYVHAVSYHS
jgi:calpain-7